MTKDEEIEALKLAVRSLTSSDEQAKTLTGKRALKKLLAVDKPKTDWSRVDKKCPNCGKEGHVEPDFGIRRVRDVERAQPWCRECRNNTHYYDRPRSNVSKNWPSGSGS